MADPLRKSSVRRVPLSELRGDISHLLREAEKGDIVITRRGRPAGVLIGFASEDDWFDYQNSKTIQDSSAVLHERGRACVPGWA